MSDYTASINSKGCDKTGVTEDLASELYHGGRSTMLAIVELSVVKDSNNHVTGTKGVQLMIDTIEPVVCGNSEIEERAQNDIRRVMRALFMNRKMAEGETLPLDDTEPKLADVLSATEALVKTDEAGAVAGLYDGSEGDGSEPAEPEAPEAPEPEAEPDVDQADEAEAEPSNLVRPAFSGG